MSEWIDCPKCGTNHENMCACPDAPFGLGSEDECPKPARGGYLIGETVRSVMHRHIGLCQVTETCLYMQRTNPDTTSMYVEHDGDLKEVTKALVHEIDQASSL